MDERIRYVYVARDEEDFEEVSASALEIDDSLFFNERLNCFIIYKSEKCDILEDCLRNSRDVTQAVQDFFEECKAKCVIEEDDEEDDDEDDDEQRFIFLIHFGGRDENVCRDETVQMNQAISNDSNLKKHYFVSVSRTNHSPVFFFTDEDDLDIPRIEDYEGEKEEEQEEPFVISLNKEWEDEGSFPDYDHLRGITILCRTLLEMEEHEREKKLTLPGAKWWFQTIWNETHPKSIKNPFSKAEQRILERNDMIKNFCSEFFNDEINLKQYDNSLRDIMLQITALLNNAKQRITNQNGKFKITP